MKKKKTAAKDYYVRAQETLGAIEFDRRVYRFSVLSTVILKRKLHSEKKLDSILGKGAGKKILNARISCLDSDLLIRYTARIIYLAFSGHFAKRELDVRR